MLSPIAAGQEQTAAASCQQDLRFLPAFLLANDTGAPDHLNAKGQATLDTALSKALEASKNVKAWHECMSIVREYLRAWCPGHL
jgi:hypothetical protein